MADTPQQARKSPSLPARQPAAQPAAQSAKVDTPLFSFDEFLSVFRRTRIYIFLACLLLGATVFYLAREDVKSSPEFTSSTDIEILPGDLEMGFARSVLGGTRDSQIASLGRSISEELTSDAVMTRAVEAVFGSVASLPKQPQPEEPVTRLKNFVNWLNYGERPATAEDPLEDYRKAINIESIDGSFVMRISATLNEPEQAAKLANALVTAYGDLKGKRLDKARAEMRVAFQVKINEAEAELRALVDRELELTASLPAAPSDAIAAVLPADQAAELRANRQSQEAALRAIASLKSDLADREIGAAVAGTQLSVLRVAQPPDLPSGPSPMVKGISFAAGLFVFLIGCLVLASILRSISGSNPKPASRDR